MIAALKVAALKAAMHLPEGLASRLARVPAEVDGQRLDPGMRWFLTLVGLDPVPQHRKSVAAQREQIHLAELGFASEVRGATITMDSVQLPGRSLPVRVYRPAGGGVRPALVYLHGGGWTVGAPDSYDALCARFARDADCVVLSLDYRLAPEHRYPAAALDALEGFAALRARAADWGVDPARMAVGGDSAGGNLSAVVANELGSAVCFALLLYPGVDLAEEAASMERFATGFFLTRDHVRWFEDQYVDRANRAEPMASPLRAARLGRAPTLVVTAGLDPLRDSGRAYAARLAAEGVPSALLEFPGLVHGFLTLDGVLPAADAANAEITARLLAAFRGEAPR